MPPAIIGGAIAAVGAVGGAAISAGAAGKASKQAAATEAANQARLAEVYQKNTANIDPFMQRGNAAGDAINSILGLPTAQPSLEKRAATPDALNALMGSIGPKRTQTYQQHFAGNPDLSQDQQARYLLSLAHPDERGIYEDALGPQGTVQSNMGSSSGNDGFRQYIDNSDYAFRQSEGDKGLNQGYAANGLLESGAAMKALERFRQNNQAGYRNEYLGHLGNQQGVGLSGANALAGVGTNYANAANANADSGTSARINAGLVGASALGNGLAGAANGIGTALGSSYGGGGSPVPGYGLPGGAPLPMPGYGNALSAWGQ